MEGENVVVARNGLVTGNIDNRGLEDGASVCLGSKISAINRNRNTRLFTINSRRRKVHGSCVKDVMGFLVGYLPVASVC